MKTVSSKLLFMATKRKERCPYCGFLDVIKWGRQSGHQRFKCKNCGSVFTFRRKDVSQTNRFIWFKWWIIGKQSLSQIAYLSGYSTRQLSRWFDEYLEDYPTWTIRGEGKVNLLIDGTWFPNKLCLVVYRNENVRDTLFYRLTDDEWEEEIEEDLRNIQALGLEIESVTSDGGKNIIRAISTVCPNALRQRCLAHVQRECLTWLTRRPQSDAGRELRKIVTLICKIESRNDMICWKQMLSEWHEKHVRYINAKSITTETIRRDMFNAKMLLGGYAKVMIIKPNNKYAAQFKEFEAEAKSSRRGLWAQ